MGIQRDPASGKLKRNPSSGQVIRGDGDPCCCGACYDCALSTLEVTISGITFEDCCHASDPVIGHRHLSGSPNGAFTLSKVVGCSYRGTFGGVILARVYDLPDCSTTSTDCDILVINAQVVAASNTASVVVQATDGAITSALYFTTSGQKTLSASCAVSNTVNSCLTAPPPGDVSGIGRSGTATLSAP